MRSLSSQLDWEERSTTCTILLRCFFLSHSTVLLEMPNKGDRILVLHEQEMSNCDIERKLDDAPPNVRRKRFQELGHTSDRPRRSRKLTINTTRNRQLVKKRVQQNSTVSMRKTAREKRYLARIGQPNSQTRASIQALQVTKGQLLTADNKRVRLEGWLLWTGSEFLSQMISNSPSNKPTIARTTGASAPKLPARLPSSTAKIQSPWWFGPEFATPVRPLWFSSMRG